MNKDFEVIETQAQLDSIMKPRLERQKEGYESKITELENQISELKKTNTTLSEQVESLNSEINEKKSTIDDINSQLAQKDEKIEAFTIDQMRYDLAYEYGIPRDFSSRLKGSTYEEIEADAKSMADTFKRMTPEPPTRSNEPEVVTGLEAGYARMADNLFKGD